MIGRGRGEPQMPERRDGRNRPAVLNVQRTTGTSSSDSESNSGSGSQERTSSSDQAVVRGRGGYRLNTIPANITTTSCTQLPRAAQSVDLLSNFVEIKPMEGRIVYQYRFDFEPNIESVQLRRRLVGTSISQQLFESKLTFDGMSDGRSSKLLDREVTEVNLPAQGDVPAIKVTIKKVGNIDWGSGEMLRLYNMGMRDFLRILGFFQLQRGVYVHPELNTPVANHQLKILRGYETAANVHKENRILMNMDCTHKLMQDKTVLTIMNELLSRNRDNFKEAIRVALVNKLIITTYNNKCYRIEDIDFEQNARTCFDRNGQSISYKEYFKTVYDITLNTDTQPMVRVKLNNSARRQADSGDERPIFVPPELCRLAGLTSEQVNDMRLKMDLVRSCQLSPDQRVTMLNTFLAKIHSNERVREILTKWGYDYDRNAKLVKAHVFAPEKICWQSTLNADVSKWKPIDGPTAGFEQHLRNERIAVAPTFRKMYAIAFASERNSINQILSILKSGFDQVGLHVGKVETIVLEQDRPTEMRRTLESLPNDSELNLIVMPRQNKERYDMIKRYSTCDRGIPTQVVTSKLMMDPKKARGAATKIALQVAAKIGGEPWRIHLPLKETMVCGYDTYHDTTNRGRSYGAFVASTNAAFSTWFSKINRHERLEELSTNLSEDLADAITNYKAKNGSVPSKIILFRDGVGDGDIPHVFKVEVKQARKAIKKVAGTDCAIQLTFIIVNKRVGARFYRKFNNQITNPLPGTVVDNTVTREGRYDFYLISQSTRQGTVSPTYYNILFDESGLPMDKLQLLAYKMSLNYYNWSGGVRVPAPCQYAHKLAFQTGESLHELPSAKLVNNLHYL